MKRKKKLTTAQRRANAKASWARRKAAATEVGSLALPVEPVTGATPQVAYIPAPKIAYAVREGDGVAVCFGSGGSLNRELISDELARKLLRELTAILV